MAVKHPTIETEFTDVESCGYCKFIIFTGNYSIINCEHKPNKFTTNSLCDKFEWKVSK